MHHDHAQFLDEMQSRDQSWLGYLLARRADAIHLYQTATMRCVRIAARKRALHYGRLARRYIAITGVTA